MPQTTQTFLRAHWPSLLLALILNSIVLTNAILHHPKIGYDVTEHLKYVQVLPERLPNDQDTGEFFSPPLPYFLPSLVNRVCEAAQGSNCTGVAGKAAQVLNFFLSIGITILLWKLAERLRPGSETFKISLLAMLGLLTVYYRTFSQARGEPYVALLIVILAYQVLVLLQKADRVTWKDGLGLGLTAGLLVLSRQWGFLALPALALPLLLVLLKNRPAGWRLGKALVVAGIVAFVVGGWFYLRLYSKYGSFTAFNQDTMSFSFDNQPSTFYRNLYIENNELFQTPVRPYFDRTLWPVFYADTWGDYWGFFSYIWIDNPAVSAIANGDEMAPLLGRVNLVSLYPTLILLGGLAWGLWNLARALLAKRVEPRAIFNAFLLAAVVTSFLGYLWFLVVSPLGQFGNTNKATYMIQIFMLMPLLSAELLEQAAVRQRKLYWVIMAVLLLVFLHNLPVMFTRFYWYMT